MNSLYKEKLNGVHNHKNSIQMLVLGNSHANYGVDPNVFSVYAYNIANVNQSLYFDKRLTLKILPELPNLKYVLINIDYHSLYFSSQGIFDIWSYYGYKIKYKNTSYLLANISPFLFGYTPLAAKAIITRHFYNKWKYKNEKIIDFDVEEGVNLTDSIQKGFISYEKHNPELFNYQLYKSRADFFNSIVTESKEENEVIADLTNFIRTLKSKGITPVIFSCPTYSEYNALLMDSIKNQNNKVIDSICQSLQVRYLDFSNASGFDKIDFYNCDHLNKAGAKKFSTMLNDSIFKTR
jgi:hypothetical protein